MLSTVHNNLESAADEIVMILAPSPLVADEKYTRDRWDISGITEDVYTANENGEFELNVTKEEFWAIVDKHDHETNKGDDHGA